MCSFNTGATLNSQISSTTFCIRRILYALVWIGRVDNHSVLRFVIDNEVSVVVACRILESAIFESIDYVSGEDALRRGSSSLLLKQSGTGKKATKLTTSSPHGNRLNMHGATKWEQCHASSKSS
jgi:hypothetical protein